MDRFSWCNGELKEGENNVVQQPGVRLYDGETKTTFDNGIAMLTTHGIMWRDPSDPACIISLPLSSVVYVEEQASGFAKSAKIVLHLHPSGTGQTSGGPVSSSSNTYIKLSFRSSGQIEFHRCLVEELKQKRWAQTAPAATARSLNANRGTRVGITGIERNIAQKAKATDQDISQAFQDLSKLVDKAKEMVSLSKSISEKIRQHKGDITDDETVRFKSYLLSMGIPDPVTRETHGTGDKYYCELAKQIVKMLETPVKECGGMMTLTDAYCRVNRARGMELLSPEDLVNACRLLETLQAPIRLRVFDSGVMVVQLQSHSEAEIVVSTSQMVDENGSLTADELSQIVGLSVVLSRERLLSAEKAGQVCRDESIEGMRFYSNAFTRAIDTSQWLEAVS